MAAVSICRTTPTCRRKFNTWDTESQTASSNWTHVLTCLQSKQYNWVMAADEEGHPENVDATCNISTSRRYKLLTL